jgi:integrase
MDIKIKNELEKKRPNLSKQSLSTYTSTLKNLLLKVFPTSDEITDFDKSEEILKFLKDIEPNKRKSILSALVVLTDNKDYRTQMIDDIGDYNKEQSKQIKNEKQSDSWIENDEIVKLFEKLKKNSNLIYKKDNKTIDDLQQIQNYIILCLLGGIYIPPRRSKDYVDFKIKSIDMDKDNYIRNKGFCFNSYKTYKTYGQQNIEVPKSLMTIIRKWIKINPTDYLLFDNNYNKLTNVKLNQRLNKLFDGKISVNQLRHTFLTDKYQDMIETKQELEKDFKDMGSSILQEKVYIKKNKSKV